MAKVMFDPGVSGYRGKAGNSVFRKTGSGTVLAKRPERADREPSEAQLAQRQRFGEAVKYGNRALKNPARRAVYEEAARRSGQTLFSLMVQDFFNGPEVKEIDLSSYEGAPGDAITVVAEDDIEVVRVDVVVTEADGTLLEEGPASKDLDGRWVYATTAPVPSGTAVRIAATATDGPDHTHTLEKETTL